MRRGGVNGGRRRKGKGVGDSGYVYWEARPGIWFENVAHRATLESELARAESIIVWL